MTNIGKKVNRVCSALLMMFLPSLVVLIASSSFAQDSIRISSSPVPAEIASLHRTWQVGGIMMLGWAPSYVLRTPELHYHESLQFYTGSAEAGRMLTAVRGKSFLAGRGEAVVEVAPLWFARAPTQNVQVYSRGNTYPGTSRIPQRVNHGLSITPLLFRWNFMNKEEKRATPWVQVGSGLLWTTQNFPLQTNLIGGHTSRINFTPQVGFGEDLFVQRNQSLNISVRTIHTSSAGLGEYNPGVNVLVQFGVGYSWWK